MIVCEFAKIPLELLHKYAPYIPTSSQISPRSIIPDRKVLLEEAFYLVTGFLLVFKVLLPLSSTFLAY